MILALATIHVAMLLAAAVKQTLGQSATKPRRSAINHRFMRQNSGEQFCTPAARAGSSPRGFL
jgi:hypothetical protein